MCNYNTEFLVYIIIQKLGGQDVDYQRIYLYEKGNDSDKRKVTYADTIKHNWCYYDGGTDPYITGYTVKM